MFFHDISIRNYKGYKDSARLDLDKGINVVVGKNNAGKTALLDALSLRFPANPHRSILTKPSPSRVLRQTSTADFTFSVTRDELVDMLIDVRGDVEFRLPLPALTDPAARELEIRAYDDDTAKRFGEWFFSHEELTVRMRREGLSRTDEANWYVLEDSYVSPRFERATENDSSTSHYCNFTIDPYDREFSFRSKITVGGGKSRYYDDFPLRMARLLQRLVYRFEAERLPSLPCTLGTNRVLTPDASNLAEVLHLLAGTHDLFGEYIRLVREVIPEVRQVGTRRLDEKTGEVVVWNDEGAASRDDLAFSLSESGAGIGNVLAILYVMLTAADPQVIIIDEPQGFLHPGAARKLMEVLRGYSSARHQLIIATHSPTIITAADPTTITLVKQEGPESVFEKVDVKDVEQQRKYLWAIGARLSDVFGYDRILWVEGETEEICFPMILRELAGRPLLGTAILRVQQTGDFSRKAAKSVLSIYERLSQLEGGLVPPVVGFIFDRDDRSDTELADLKRQSRGRVRFTERRMYESYLLLPDAIAAVANSISGFSEQPITPEHVRLFIEGKRVDQHYYQPFPVPPVGDETWINSVHAARLLKDLFRELSRGMVPYEKPDHSVMLTRWLIDNRPADLETLSSLLVDTLSGHVENALRT
jgi:predicted ATPase